jgi:hypothetical protein
VTVRHDDQIYTVSRQATGQSPKIVRSFPLPIIFSQSEIESVGLQPNGRRHLVDEFITRRGTGTMQNNNSKANPIRLFMRSSPSEAVRGRWELSHVNRIRG